MEEVQRRSFRAEIFGTFIVLRMNFILYCEVCAIQNIHLKNPDLFWAFYAFYLIAQAKRWLEMREQTSQNRDVSVHCQPLNL